MVGTAPPDLFVATPAVDGGLEGTQRMFEAAGFRVARDMGTWSVMRHDLGMR